MLEVSSSSRRIVQAGRGYSFCFKGRLGGRAKLVASAMATTGALAFLVPLALLVTLIADEPRAGWGSPPELVESLAIMFALAAVALTIMHVGLWLIGRFGSALGVLSGVVLLVGVLALTMRVVSLCGSRSEELLVYALTITVIAVWTLMALVIVSAARLNEAAHSCASRLRLRHRASRFGDGARYTRGRELEPALGTARPWFFAAGLAVPFGAALWFFDDPTVWSFYLALFAAILGGLAGFAAARTRRLWLRTELDRAALYAHVERAYWRHSAYGLAALAACHAALGLYTGLPPVRMAWGVLTLALGTFTSLYLGLTMARGIGWRTAVTTIATMTLLMFTASRAAAPDANVAAVAALELALLGLAFVFRSVAVKRWAGLDWSHCRAGTEARAAA